MSYPIFTEWSQEEKVSLLSDLKILEQKLNKSGYQVILHGGTLLGAIRERDLIAKDNDIDLIILHTPTNKEQVKAKIIELDTQFYNDNATCKDLHFIGNNHYFINNHHFDIWHGWIDEEDKCNVFYSIYGTLNKDDIFPLKQINLLGFTFQIPNNSVKLLKHLYGDDWKIPSSKKPTKSSRQVYEFFNGHRCLYPTQKLTQKEILCDLAGLLDTFGINYWLQTGTLLGAIRDKNFIEWDEKDIDIGLDIKDYWKVKELLDKSDFKYKWQWNKEIAVYEGEHPHPHIDLFFHTFDDKFAYCYSYKPNRITTIWNEEWRMKIPRKILEPLQTIQFLDRNFKIPNKPEKYLEYLYGENWQIPDKNWSFKNFGSIDNDYQAITAIVTTYCRNESLNKLVNSFCNLFPEITLIIGNQNPEKLVFDAPNIKVIQLEEDCGLSAARNELVKHVKTEFTLLLEDDFVITKQTDIYRLLEIFSYDKDIQIVGGRLIDNNKIKSYEKFLFVMDKVLLSIDWAKLKDNQVVNFHKINRTEFGIADIIYNFFLARTENLKNYPWDNNHKVHSEHIDFFLNRKINSSTKIAFIPEVLVGHEHTTSTNYEQLRQRMYYDLIYKKYGIEKGYTIGESAILNYKDNKKETI